MLVAAALLLVAATPYADPGWARLVERARASGRLEVPYELGALRRGAHLAPGLAPAGVVVATARPTFRWPAGEGARHTVVVSDGEREVARSPRLAKACWTPPRDLPRGEVLSWHVERGDGRSGPVLFKIATAAQMAEIAKARAAHPDDHLLHAVLYARAGLMEEARAAQARAGR